MTSRGWMPVKEAARLSGITVRKLYRWIHEGRITVRDGPVTRVDVREVQEVVELCRDGRLPRLDHAE